MQSIQNVLAAENPNRAAAVRNTLKAVTIPVPSFLVNLSERYYEYNFNKMNQPGAFNYIKVTITNNSATTITMGKELAFYDTRWWYWNTQDKKDVVIPAKATISIIYSANSGSGVWNTNDIEQVSSPYTINGEKVYPVYDVDEQVWEYQ